MDQQFVRQRLTELIETRGLSVRDLSIKSQMGEQRLRHFLAGRAQAIKPHFFRNVLTAVGISEQQFFDPQHSITQVERIDVIPAQYRIPIFGEIPAGNPTWIEGNTVATEFATGDERDKRRRAFALRVSGRSMEPKYLPGDLLVFRPLSIPLPIKDPQRPTPRATFDALHGRTVAVLLNGEATLKTLEVLPGKDSAYLLSLRPLNPAYQSITIQPTDEAQFQGEVYKIIREE